MNATCAQNLTTVLNSLSLLISVKVCTYCNRNQLSFNENLANQIMCFGLEPPSPRAKAPPAERDKRPWEREYVLVLYQSFVFSRADYKRILVLKSSL